MPVDARNYFLYNCFWVSGQYKGQGYAKELLRLVIEDTKNKIKMD
jgi:RimJ/RimL family protein N-acetyltransferase